MSFSKPSRPLLRYHGGKWQLAQWIISFFPEHRTYVEPFGGAASVLLLKDRSHSEVYNDLDHEIVNLFKVMRDNGDQLQKLVRLTPFARDEFVQSYEPTADPIEQARRTIVRSFMGFSSSWRINATGFRYKSRLNGTGPANDWKNYSLSIQKLIERLSGVVIENQDALKVIQSQQFEDTLYYVDPPYVFATRDSGSDYAFEYNDDQHRELAECLKSIQGMVFLSGYKSKLYEELYLEWHCVKKKAYADGARHRTECLWMNHAAWKRQNLQMSFDL